MALTLHFHPLSSNCWKVLLALHENATDFAGEVVNFGDEASRARFFALAPLGKIPVLRDDKLDRTIPETSAIIEYLDRHYPGVRRLLPDDPEACLEARLLDRIFDFYVMTPMQQIVGDRLRPEGERDPRGVADARGRLSATYDFLEARIASRACAAGEDFTIADCAAAPSLFYAGILVPFGETHPGLAAYFERLLARPAFQRVLADARPWFQYFPFVELMPARFLDGEGGGG